MARIHITSTEDAVAVIAAYSTRAIAQGDHPGHDLTTVGTHLTSDLVFNAIRDAYERHIAKGATPKDAIIRVGQALIAAYCTRANIPATR
ncbi:hypothetical protein [Streptomyces sp. SID11385]|uniref:hypothetical protein n=1 Tax=Streptomyces sp. SID11385 TaxID=2706031 RepID=UPI0013CA24E5|nr:hypothetical protein [Streptomyces sp. SID11385]NEA42756.1 hypothetical protein [Streptomyces sp. SID11385]